MSGLIFNSPEDNYIFTGSNVRAGTNITNLRLSKGNNTHIDIYEEYIDISAVDVFINNERIVTSSSAINFEISVYVKIFNIEPAVV